jgi:hypothetical protein
MPVKGADDFGRGVSDATGVTYAAIAIKDERPRATEGVIPGGDVAPGVEEKREANAGFGAELTRTGRRERGDAENYGTGHGTVEALPLRRQMTALRAAAEEVERYTLSPVGGEAVRFAGIVGKLNFRRGLVQAC